MVINTQRIKNLKDISLHLLELYIYFKIVKKLDVTVILVKSFVTISAISI